MSDFRDHCWWAVTGRMPGDDDDVCHIFFEPSLDAALHQFTARLLSESDESEREELLSAARDDADNEYGLLVTSRVASFFKIEDVGATGKLSTPSMLDASSALCTALGLATRTGLFDELAADIHPDVINQFVDAVERLDAYLSGQVQGQVASEGSGLPAAPGG